LLPQYKRVTLTILTSIKIQGASKTFGTRKKEGTNKLTVLAFKMILIIHNTLLATFIKASGKCQQSPLQETITEPCKNACVCTKSSMNGIRKQKTKEDTIKLTTLAFKMIHILHNTLLATHKIKFYLGAFFPFGESPKLKFYSWVFANF
jgi:hypothetical protein